MYKMISNWNVKSNTWDVIRWNTETGRTYHLHNGKWIAIKEKK